MSVSKVTKNDLVDAVYKSTNIEKQEIQTVIESFLVHVRDSLAKGGTIELRGFGTFEPRLRKGREAARNPKTGEILSVEPHYVAAFRAGQILKDKLWDLKIKNDEEK